jgi:hypothetical protein
MKGLVAFIFKHQKIMKIVRDGKAYDHICVLQ